MIVMIPIRKPSLGQLGASNGVKVHEGGFGKGVGMKALGTTGPTGSVSRLDVEDGVIPNWNMNMNPEMRQRVMMEKIAKSFEEGPDDDDIFFRVI